ncbi:MAG: hypothetical protein V4642_00355 [Bacteroidota bacterium]
MKILLGLVLICRMCSVASAQEDFDQLSSPGLEPKSPPSKIYIGMTGGYGRIFHSEGISNPLNNQNFDPARSNSFFAGFNGEYVLGEPRNSESSIILKVYYSNLTTAESTFSESEQILMPDGQITTLKTENIAVFKASFINTEALYVRTLFGTVFSLSGGFGAKFPFYSSIEKRKVILEPENMTLKTADERYRSEQDGRTLVFNDEEIDNINYYGIVGISYNIYRLWGKKLDITPSLFYNFGLNKATSTESFKINSLQFGLDFKAGL